MFQSSDYLWKNYLGEWRKPKGTTRSNIKYRIVPVCTVTVSQTRTAIERDATDNSQPADRASQLTVTVSYLLAGYRQQTHHEKEHKKKEFRL